MSDFRSDCLRPLILAGGRGRRMGGKDKGLVTFRGQPLVIQVCERLGYPPEAVLLSANRHQTDYRDLGFRVVEDRVVEGQGDFPGPLAGIQSGFHQADRDWLLVAPCDTPCLPPDLAPRLWQAANQARADIAVAHDGRRLHPPVALLQASLKSSLDAYLKEGLRRIDQWYARHSWVTVDFSDQAEAFVNLNTEEERWALENHLGDHDPVPPVNDNENKNGGGAPP